MWRLLTTLLLSLLVPLGIARATDDQLQGDARAWLSLVDQQKYDASWEAASSLFRSQINEVDWKKAVSTVREPLGPLISRTLEETNHATSLPGAPDGESAILQFQPHFKNKELGTETLTLVREDGDWKIAGYFIK